MTQHARRFACFLAGITLLAVIVVGCGGPRGSVSGTVTVDGVPIEKGVITFVPAEGSGLSNVAAEIVAGKYELPADRGPLPGKYKVEFTSQKKTGKKLPTGDGDATIDETEQTLPPKLNTQSTHSVDIARGANKNDFQLTSK